MIIPFKDYLIVEEVNSDIFRDNKYENSKLKLAETHMIHEANKEYKMLKILQTSEYASLEIKDLINKNIIVYEHLVHRIILNQKEFKFIPANQILFVLN